jgi:cell division topological specificity factor
MIEFLKRFFGHQGSSATAKERLRLVLMTDHLELAPEMIESMKRELVDVISRHVEVDRDKIDVRFERQDRTLAMLANIPILSVNRPNGNGTIKRDEPVTSPPDSAKPRKEKRTAASAKSLAGETPPTRKRRRRKKSHAAPLPLTS